MKSEFLISGIETGKLNAMVKNIMNQTGIAEPEEAVRMMNSGRLQVSVINPKWTEMEGVVRFSVTSDGTNGEQWIARLESKSIHVGNYAKIVLRSKSFKPTSGLTYEIVVLKGELFSDNECFIKTIRKEAKKRKFFTPNPEVACLLREKFSDDELKVMGLNCIIVMHEPINDSDGDPELLGVDFDDNRSWLSIFNGLSDSKWDNSNGFAFVERQVSAA